MRPSRLGGLLLVAAAAIALVSCPSPNNYPGVLVATFSFEARPAPGGVAACLDAGYTEIPAPDASFAFVATFSGEEDGTISWMTIRDFTRDASFDGRVVASSHSAPRQFARCQDAGVDEDFQFAPVSLSQSIALSGVCPPNPLAPGSIPLDPDAGILPPGLRNGQFDSVRACGVLVDTIRSGGDVACQTCTMTFEVTGVRL